jgi:hypothetical protein
VSISVSEAGPWRHEVRAHLLEQVGDLAAARDSYQLPARLDVSAGHSWWRVGVVVYGRDS